MKSLAFLLVILSFSVCFLRKRKRVRNLSNAKISSPTLKASKNLKNNKKYIPLEKVKENVKTYLSMEKFDTKIQKLAKETKCEINQKHIDEIDSPN